MKAQLRMHKEAKHDGIRYPCDECEYLPLQKVKLKCTEKPSMKE